MPRQLNLVFAMAIGALTMSSPRAEDVPASEYNVPESVLTKESLGDKVAAMASAASEVVIYHTRMDHMGGISFDADAAQRRYHSMISIRCGALCATRLPDLISRLSTGRKMKTVCEGPVTSVVDFKRFDGSSLGKFFMLAGGRCIQHQGNWYYTSKSVSATFDARLGNYW